MSYLKKTVRNNKYSKLSKYKINMQKSIAFLYTNNELVTREIKKAIPFTIASKKNKFNQGGERPIL